jgi:ABC-type Na+ efflux pump permease subunit
MKRKGLFLLLLVMLLEGCATTGAVLKKAKEGENVITEVFNAPYNKVFLATKHACAEAGLAIEESSEEENYIVASSPPQTFQAFWTGTGYGALVGIYFEKKGENQTLVKIAAKSRFTLDFGARDPRKELLVCIEKELLREGIIK